MWGRLGAGEGKEMLFCLFVFLLLTIHNHCQPCGQKCKAGGTELELTQPEKMVGLLKGSLLWGSALLTSRSAVKLSLDGCSSCSLKNSLFCVLNSPVAIVLLRQKKNQKTVKEDILLSLLWRIRVRESSCCFSLRLQHFFEPEQRTLCFNYLVACLHTFSPRSTNSLSFVIHIQAKEYT